MPRIETGFIDGSGDLGSSLVDKEFLIQSFPQLLNQNKIPTLWTWGKNSRGELGDNTTISRSSPVQTIARGSDWKFIAINGRGAERNKAAGIKTDGTLWLWGSNCTGTLGNNNTADISSPVQTVAGGTNWRSVSIWDYGGAAIKTDGTLWTWGGNFHGTQGTNDRVQRSSPVQTISGGTNWLMQATAPLRNMGAIKCDGTLWLWGENRHGELGNETQGCWEFPPSTSVSSPIQTVAGGTNWRILSMGGDHSAAIKTDGTLWIWGKNNWGQLATNNTINDRSSPVQTISGGTNWKFISSHVFGSVAIKTDGSLWTWGNFVLNATTLNNSKSSPVQTTAGGTNWLRACASLCGAIGLKTDGSLWGWGCGNDGQLGDNNTVNRTSSPVLITTTFNWRNAQISCSAAIAIRDLDSD